MEIIHTSKGSMFRINGAFGTFEEWQERIQNLRKKHPQMPVIVDLPRQRLKHRTNQYSDDDILEWINCNDIAFVAISYVERGYELEQFQRKIDAKICAKLETVEGLKNINQIMACADMIMIDMQDLKTDIVLHLEPMHYVVMER